MKRVLLSILFFATTLCFGQSFAHVDSHVAGTPNHLKKNIEKLSLYLTAPFNTETEKVRAIYVWLAKNIAYDVKAARAISRIGFETVKDADTRNQEIIKNTLRDNKGVCQGYALCFKKMCDIAGIKNHVVVGFSKKEDGSVFTQYPSHAWNAAFVNNKWHLFDVTWGAGYVSGNSFTPRLNDNFFMADTENFRLRHLPADPMWQLSKKPITLNNFIGKSKGEIWTTNFNYVDSLNAYYQLPQDLMPLKTARNAYNFDPKNSSRIAVAYTNYANKFANSALKNQKVSGITLESLLQDNQRAIEAQKIAYSMDHSDEIKHGLGIFYANHASYMNDQAYKWIQQDVQHDNAIEIRQKSLEYLNEAKLYHADKNFIRESIGFTYLGIGFAYFKKGIKYSNDLESYNKASTAYKKAISYLEGLRSSNAKNGLKNCLNNLEVIKSNIAVIKRQNRQ